MVLRGKILSIAGIGLAVFGLVLGCGKKSDDPTPSTRFMYVASGSCYGGGVATSSASDTITAYNLATGDQVAVIADYNASSPGDGPNSLAAFDPSHILVGVENAAGRRIDTVSLTAFNGLTTYLTNAAALNGVIRSMDLLSDGTLLVSKSSAIEKFSSGKSRITQGANPYVNAPAGSCATSTTLISSVGIMPNGAIVYSHAAATPNNKFGIISATGYAAAADCLAAQAGPTTTALPTSVLPHSSGKLLVAYGSVTTASNSIYSYDVDSVTNAISNATAAWTDFTVVNGPSAMAEDPTTHDVFVANGTSTFNTIERFKFNSTTRTLTRVGSSPFIGASIYTRCVTSILIPY